MKTHIQLPLLVGFAFVPAATAQDIIKAQNSHALNTPASWVGGVVPGPTNTAVWDAASTTSTHKSASLGADLTWQGVRIDGGFTGTIANYTLAGSNTLTLGSAGIGIAVLSVEFQHPLTFSADAALTLHTDSRGITFNGPTDLGGHTLTVVSNKNTRFLAGSGGLSNGTLRFTSGPHNGQSQFNAASTGNFTLLGTGSALIIVDKTVTSNPQLDVNLADTSRFVLGRAFDSQTLEVGSLTGDPGARIFPDFNFSTDKPTVVRTLSVNQTIDGTYAGLLTDSNNNRDLGFTKNGNATLVLTNPLSEYSGPTTINSGTIHITGAGRLNYRPIPNQAVILGTYPGAITSNGTFHLNSSAIQEFTGPISGSGSLRKSNTGFLTLTGDGSGFSGDTVVDGGRLTFTNALNGDVTLGGGASLAGTGTSTGSLTTVPNATLILSGGPTTTALSFAAATIAGPTYVEFASPQQDAVVYDVLSYGAGGLTGYENLVPLARGTLSHDTLNNKVIFTAIAPGVRTWNTGDGAWDSQGILENWAGGDKIFIQGDQAVFPAIPTDTTITLDGLLAPSIVTVENPASTYTFSGSGGLSGSGTFDKTAAGILRIANANPNYAGPTLIGSGIFRFLDGSNWGTSPITNNASLEIENSNDLIFTNGIAGTGTLTQRGTAPLTLAGATESTFTGNVTVQSGRLVLDKETALGYGNSGTKSVTINPGAQLDLNNYADTQHKEVKKPWLTYTFKIAGDGDGTGAIINTRGGSLRIGTKNLDFAGILNLELTADASIGGTAGYDVGLTHNVTGAITGNGHTLTKRGPNTIHLRAPASNIPLVVQEGILGIENHGDAFGGATGSVTVYAPGSVGVSIGDSSPWVVPTPVTLHAGATLRSLPDWYSSFVGGLPTWSGPVTLSGTANILTDPEDFLITGTVSGSGGIVKTGPQILTLAQSNTYTGPTTVSEGTLVIQQPYLSDTAAVAVETGTILNLDFTGTDIVGALTLGGAVMDPGVYNATTHPLLLSGTGALEVVDANDYDNWSGSSGFNLNGGPDDDDDHDGLSNFGEYAFGLDPTSPSSLRPHTPPDRSAGTFTYTRPQGPWLHLRILHRP